MDGRIHIQKGKCRIAYQKAGSGPALVLLHGFPANGDLWSNITATLGRRNTILIPDLPGAGSSTCDTDQLSMENMADMTAALLEQEHISTAVIAGHSMGGYAALAFAESYPQYVRGISLVHSSAYADDEEKKAARRKSIELIKKEGGKEAFIRQMIPNLFSEKTRAEHKHLIEEQIAEGLATRAESLVSFYNAMILRKDRTMTLQKTGCPVQLIIGREDTAVSPAKVLEQAKLPEVCFVEIYEHTAHMSMLEQPERLAEDINRFTEYCNSRNLEGR